LADATASEALAVHKMNKRFAAMKVEIMEEMQKARAA